MKTKRLYYFQTFFEKILIMWISHDLNDADISYYEQAWTHICICTFDILLILAGALTLLLFRIFQLGHANCGNDLIVWPFVFLVITFVLQILFARTFDLRSFPSCFLVPRLPPEINVLYWLLALATCTKPPDAQILLELILQSKRSLAQFPNHQLQEASESKWPEYCR